MVFGKALINAQVKALADLKLPCNLLIAGGGDGEILKYLADFKGELDYVEISPKMIQLAKSKTELRIHWHIQDIFTFDTERKYDVIFLPFLLDNFSSSETKALIKRLAVWLKPSSNVIISDYTEKPNLWQRLILKLMYIFFKIVAGVNVSNIPPIESIMERSGFKKESESFHYGRFIETKVYVR